MQVNLSRYFTSRGNGMFSNKCTHNWSKRSSSELFMLFLWFLSIEKDDTVICCGACKSPPMRDPIFRGTSRSQIENYERFSPAVATESLRRRRRISLKVHCQKRKDKS